MENISEEDKSNDSSDPQERTDETIVVRRVPHLNDFTFSQSNEEENAEADELEIEENTENQVQAELRVSEDQSPVPIEESNASEGKFWQCQRSNRISIRVGYSIDFGFSNSGEMFKN